MGKIQSGKLLYHLTKLSNLDSIIERGLVSRSFLEHNRTPFSDVADPEIMDKRKEFGLDAYIPFHFHPYSSFDVAVKNRYEEEFIYICITRSFARSNHFLILPIHPLSAEQVQLLDYDAGITAIDWAAMESSSTLSDRNKNVRMAECLTDKAIPVSCFHSIAVRNESIRNLVQQKLPVFHDKKLYVDIRPWLQKSQNGK